MNQVYKVQEGLYYIGGIDRRLQRFENIHPVPQGVTYNSYLIKDEKNCLMDGVDKAIGELFIENIDAVLDGEPLDYMVVNHVEPDHCQTIRLVLDLHPEAVLLTNAKAIKFLEQFYPYDFASRAQLIKDKDVIDLGKHKLEFVQAANVHWPEVTMVYEQTEKWLFSADAFGSFKAFDGALFADQTNWERDWLDEFRRYYVNIVGKFGGPVNKLLDKLSDREIKMILPLHALMFRTAETIGKAIDKYRHWASYEAEEQGVVIVYGSLYENSMMTADRLARELVDRGVREVRVFDVSGTDYSSIIAQCFRLSNAVFVCNNYNTELFPNMDAFLRELVMLNWDNHNFSLIGNGSWGGKGIKIAEEILARAKKLEKVGETVQTLGSLSEETLPELEKLADDIVASLKK
ncbi:MAG: FprA family A-type flavoprotein [Eubacteriales bacterium]|nr:FprA family A-type flavoprotein [Eubacteriales bacterium]